MASGGKEWIKADETAKQMLSRVLTERPFLALPPPLHKLPLRVGNVVEIVGPPSSAKTHVLMQAAISCILPKEWKGLQYGGMERSAAFVDLDCRFDVLRFSQLLKNRILHAYSKGKIPHVEFDEELFAACMRRFLYVRCYDSFEFLATLKTMTSQLKKQKEAQGSGVLLLMFDRGYLKDLKCQKIESSNMFLAVTVQGGVPFFFRQDTGIGAFYWMDRGRSSSSVGSNRKSMSLQSVSEVIVQEIQKLLLVNPMLVLASKTASLRNLDIKPSTNVLDMKDVMTSYRTLLQHDYMPSVWQSFVSHRIHVHPSDDNIRHNSHPIYLTEWLLPPVKSSDKFTINDNVDLKELFKGRAQLQPSRRTYKA